MNSKSKKRRSGMLTLEELEEVIKKTPCLPRKTFRDEVEFLGKFVNGGAINNEEENDILEKYASLGYVNFSFQFNGIPSAKLTYPGKLLYYTCK